MEYVKSLRVCSGSHEGHIQGIAVDAKREYFYLSSTTRLLKADRHGNVVGSVCGLAGHLGCIAYNPADGRVYGSLEYKNDSIGLGILSRLGRDALQNGFYIAIFDVDKITRMDMDAEKDGVMRAVYLPEVYDDYSAEGHRYGCSGIDGITFAPDWGKPDGKLFLCVGYGVYNDVQRQDNDHQVILRYDVQDWENYALPLEQENMHRSGPEKPEGKYFVFTGNTEYGVQNLEYDPHTRTILAAVYCGKKPQYPNWPMYFIDQTKRPQVRVLQGLDEEGLVLPLASVGKTKPGSDIPGSDFPHGSTGMISLGDGYYYFSEHFRDEKEGFGTEIVLYRFDAENATFVRA